jgi:hypothetical protein
MIGCLDGRVMQEVTTFINLAWPRCYDDMPMVLRMISFVLRCYVYRAFLVW